MSPHTVNNLRIINLLFSCMLRIKRKIVHVFWHVKYHIRYKFRLMILALLLLMRKFTQLQKNGKSMYMSFNY
jgi:hypothetical protein